MSSLNVQNATIYGKQVCPNCTNAKMFLKNNNIAFEYVSLDDDNTRKEFYEKVAKELGSPIMSVPQIWVDQKYIGGFNDLVKFINNNKKLDAEKNLTLDNKDF